MRALKLTHSSIVAGTDLTMGWMRAPLNGKNYLAHEGGTGGFSSFAAFEENGTKGVVILSDTAFGNLGGLGSLGLHLLDSRAPLGKPVKLVQPSIDLVKALVGTYEIGAESPLVFELRESKTSNDQVGLTMFVPGQELHPLQLDSAGDFFLTKVDAVVRPRKRSDGSYSVTYLQGGGALPAKRLSKDGNIGVATPKLSPNELAIYAGVYQLSATFSVRVFVQDQNLMAQATGQSAFVIEATRNDPFTADAYGIEIVFKREADGKVSSLDLYQGGRITPAKKVANP